MPSSFFHHTPSLTMEKLRGPDEIHPTPSSPRQPHGVHFSGKTLRSLFTTKRSDSARSPSVTTSSISSENGTVRSGAVDGKVATHGRVKDKVMNMGTSRRRSDMSGTSKAGDRQEMVAPSGSRLTQGTIASRSRAAQSMPPPPTASHPVRNQGTIKFPGGDRGPVERVISPASTEDSDLKSPTLPVVPQTTRKKKHSLSLFLSSSKARASLSSTGSISATETSKRSATAEISRPKGTVKARVISNPVSGAAYSDKTNAEIKRSQTTTTVRKAIFGRGSIVQNEHDVSGAAKQVSSRAHLDQATPKTHAETDPSTTKKAQTRSSRAVSPIKVPDQAIQETQESRFSRGKGNTAEAISPGITASQIGLTTRTRVQSPNAPPERTSALGIPATPASGQEGEHFVLRLAVTYLTKTILPELRSSRRESNNKPAGANAGLNVSSPQAYRKDLIEKMRPLERMERSWGIDWMLKGREGFQVSSRTREKERDAFRQAIGDGSLLLFLIDRTTIDTIRTAKLRLEAIVAGCRSLPLSLDGDGDLEAVVDMEGVQVYNAAALVVALARFAGPAGKQNGSGDDDDDVRSRSPSPVQQRTALTETDRERKRRPEPVAIVKVYGESPERSSSSLQRRPSPQPQRMAIRLPAGNYYASNAMHSKLDTVLSMTPGEDGFTPAPAASDAFEGYFAKTHTEKRPVSPSKPILKPYLTTSEEEFTSASLTESSVPFRFHSRDPTPSLISGTTDRTSMALSDLPERAPRSISFASHDDDTKRQIKNAVLGHTDTVYSVNDRQTSSDDSAVPMTPVSVSAARFRPRVQRGITVASSISSIDGNDRTPSRRNSEIKPGRPQYIPRRHTTQAPSSGTPARQGEPQGGRIPSVTRIASGSQSQAYSPPATPRRAMSPSFSESPFMPSSRRTSFTSATSQSPAGRDSLKPLVIVKDIEGRSQTYQLGNCIGKGQFGIVYRALNLVNGQFVAVKRIILENLDDDIEQIMKEVEVLKRLKHPSIVRYLGMTRDERYLDIILEYVEGGSLANASRSFGKFSEHLIACYAAKMLEGLHYLHGEDVVHCDLKAANILITKKADVRLTDFGVSLNLRAVENQKDDNVVGTPNWVAPEIISLQGASTASDIWSLGCTIVELLEGKPPWAELDSNMAVLFKIVEEEWPIPAYYSPELKDFLGLCFKKNPSDRPTAETLFDHEWIRNEIGIDPRLRNHDSIPFLRRISRDAVRLQQLKFDAGPPGLFSHSRDLSSPVDASFRNWKLDKQRPGLSDYAYSSPLRPDLRSNPGSSFSVRSDDTDPGQARPAELIEAERQRALSKLTNGNRGPLVNCPSATPVLQVHYPTRAKERLERLRESDGRRGSAETDSTTKAHRRSAIHDSDATTADRLDTRQDSAKERHGSYAVDEARLNKATKPIAREDQATIRPGASGSRDVASFTSTSSGRYPGGSVSRLDQGEMAEDRTNAKGDCTVQ